jgi:hypothetical protein
MQCGRDIDFLFSRVLYKSPDFTFKPFRETLHQSGAARKYDVAVQVDAQIFVTKLDSISCNLSDSTLAVLKQLVGPTCKLRPKHNFGSSDSLLEVYLDNLATRQFVTSLLLI